MPRDFLLTVDVEDYFHAEAFADVVDRSSWEQYPSRVESNTRLLLDLFDEFGAKATFFVLGWVAERFPRLVRDIAARGHEIACHSYWHRPVYTLQAEQFREDTRRAREVIEQAAGQRVNGYRAPSFSITASSLWALDELCQAGFTYDSSIFPIRHDFYGMPAAPRSPFRVSSEHGELIEYPLTTFRVCGQNLPVGGGGYLRILPDWYTHLGLRRAQASGIRPIVYVHPWEVDPEQPKISARARSRFRHYTNLQKTYGRLERLLACGKFQGLGACQGASAAAKQVQS